MNSHNFPHRKKAISLVVLAALLGGFFFYMGLRQLVQQYYCAPSSKDNLLFISGVLEDIEKSRRFGGSLIINANNEIYRFSIAGRLSSDLDPLKGQTISVGVFESTLCRPNPMHIQVGDRVLFDFYTALKNRERGEWFVVLLSFVLFGMSIFIFANTFFQVRKILRRSASKQASTAFDK